MVKWICSNCGYCLDEDTTYSLKEDLKYLWSSGFTIIKTICFIAIFIGLLFIPVIGWILAVLLLFVPISNNNRETEIENQCPNCKATNCLVPINTPRGKKLYREYTGFKNE